MFVRRLFPVKSFCNHAYRYSSTLTSRIEDLVKERKFKEACDIAKEELDSFDRSHPEYIDQTVQVSKVLTPFNPSLSRSLLRSGLEIDKHNPDLWYQIGMAYIREKNYEKAMEHLNQVFELDHEHCPAYCALSVIYLREGKFNESENVLQKAMKFAKNDSLLEGSVLVQYVSLYASPIYLKKNGTFKALEYADKILFETKYSKFMQTVLIILTHQMKKFVPEDLKWIESRCKAILQCRNLLEKSIRLSSDEEYKQASQCLVKAIELKSKISNIPNIAPLICQIHYRMAIVKNDLFVPTGEKAAEAMKGYLENLHNEFTTSLIYDNTFAPSWEGKGNVLLEQHNYKESLNAFEAAIHYGSQNLADIYFKLSRIYRKLNKEDEAIEYSKKALELKPQNKDIMLELFAGMAQKSGGNPTDDLLNLSENIKQTNPEFRDYYEKNKHRDPHEMMEEFDAFVDNNIRMDRKSGFKVYTNAGDEEDFPLPKEY